MNMKSIEQKSMKFEQFTFCRFIVLTTVRFEQCEQQTGFWRREEPAFEKHWARCRRYWGAMRRFLKRIQTAISNFELRSAIFWKNSKRSTDQTNSFENTCAWYFRRNCKTKLPLIWGREFEKAVHLNFWPPFVAQNCNFTFCLLFCIER